MGNISNISNNYDQNRYVAETAKTQRTDPLQGQSVEGKSEIRLKDKVSLSKTSKDMQFAEEAVKSAPDIRPEKVNPIKQKIAEGKYKVDAEGIAERMIGIEIDKLV